MKSLLFKSKTTFMSIVSVALLLVVLLIFGITTITHAASKNPPVPAAHSRLITIYDRGTTKVIYTEATTVGGALKDAGISLAQQDTVEPAATYKFVANSYSVNIYRARPVVVVDGNIRERIMTPYQTAEQITASAGITLYPEDWTTLTRIDDLSEGAGLQLTIIRATPVTFFLYGQQTTIRTHAKTVGEMLSEKGIKLASSDTLSVPASQAITADMTIQLWRNGTQTVNVTQSIPFSTQTIQDADQPIGYTSIQTPGVDGSQIVTYQVQMQDGVELSRTQIQSVTVLQSSPETEIIGTKLVLGPGDAADQVSIMTQAGITASDQGFAAYIVDHENGMWCATRWQGETGCPTSYIALYAPGAEVGYGLCQATPGNKMASAGSDWETNPVTQMEWCNSYAIGKYGSWSNAYTYWVDHHNW
jgi:uncharacterized protein YabE (DUF348 family)